MSELIPALAPLTFLLGDHVGEEDVHATRWTAAGDATAFTTGRVVAGGHMLAQDYRQVGADGAELFALHAVFMTDRETGEILLFGFDSAGYVPEPSRGRFDGTVLRLARTSPRGEARLTITGGDDGRWSQHREFRPPGGAWQPVVTAHMSRTSGSG